MKRFLPSLSASLLSLIFGSGFLSAQSSVPSPEQPFVDRHELAGAVTLVADKDKVLELRAVGYEDIAAGKAMQTDSLFWIASQSKPIVATATMMLVDEGKISLDDPITKYIPEFKEQWLLAEHDGDHTVLKKPEHPILIRHLLSHMSGMLYKTPIEQPTLDIINEEQRMHAYVMSPLQFEPGTKHLYANAGMNTAARIVELISGMHYEDFIQQRILNPLHMKDTTFWPTKQQLERLAKSYAPNAAKTALEEVPSPQLRYPLDDRTRCVQPAGGLFSTASDLLNFYRMIMTGGVFEGKRLLSEHAVQQMTSKQTGSLPKNYGFGFDTTPGKIGHGGTFGTLSAMNREHQLISIVMVQYGGPAANLSKFHQAFQRAVAAQYLPPPDSASPPKTEQPAASNSPLAAVLQTIVDHHIASGVVGLVANKNKVLDLESAGDASLNAKEPMRNDDMFWIASMTKSFTATAFMMLVDEGKVNISDPVEKYLPEFKGQMMMVNGDPKQLRAPSHPITIREILSHTSGMILAGDKSLKRTNVLKDDVAQFAKAPLLQEPGTKYEYNNSGINTAGRIIEVLSGMTYEEFLRARILEPLGLKDTTFFPNVEQAKRLAYSARFTEDKKGLVEVKLDVEVKPALIEKLSEGVMVPPQMIANFGFGIAAEYGKHYAQPAGGLYSTASDVGKFCQMLLNGGVWEGKRYLSEAALRQMSTIQTGDAMKAPNEGYGQGWTVKKKDDEGLPVGSFGHRGARRTVMWVDPKDELVLVLLVQRMDMSNEQQKEMYGSFQKAAVEKYGKAAGGSTAAHR